MSRPGISETAVFRSVYTAAYGIEALGFVMQEFRDAKTLSKTLHQRVVTAVEFFLPSFKGKLRIARGACFATESIAIHKLSISEVIREGRWLSESSFRMYVDGVGASSAQSNFLARGIVAIHGPCTKPCQWSESASSAGSGCVGGSGR